MRHYDCVQGEDEWFRLRVGIPTASEFSNIMTPKTRKMAASAVPYAYLKIAEIMTGEPQGLLQPTYWMERGKILEAEAVHLYEMTYDVTLQRGGFITDDNGWFGASPDFISPDSTGEIKCLAPKNHVQYLINPRVDPEHMPQVQGQMWLAEKEFSDYWIYHPEMSPIRVRTPRDEPYINDLQSCLNQFRELMNGMIESLIANGHFEIKDADEKARSLENVLPAG